MQNKIQYLSFLVKPASHLCNLDCPYCFYKRVDKLYRGNQTKMSDDVLESFLKKALSYGAGYNMFIWQGGEPTIMGKTFYEKVVQLQERYRTPGTMVENTLQTNGVLLDSTWAQFLYENHFLTGISIDGPKEIHDYYRFDYSKKGSYDRIIKSISSMSQAGAEHNILFLLTNKNIREPEKIYHFIKENNFGFIQFIPAYETDRSGKEQSFSIHGPEMAEFYDKIFQMWYPNDIKKISIRLFEDILQYQIYDRKTSCVYMDRCDAYLVIEHNGDVYPCDFYVNKDQYIGNILTDSLESLLSSQRREKFAIRKSQLPNACENCQIRDFCMGECPRYRPIKKGKLRKSVFCEGIYHTYQLLEENLEEIKKTVGLSNSAK